MWALGCLLHMARGGRASRPRPLTPPRPPARFSTRRHGLPAADTPPPPPSPPPADARREAPAVGRAAGGPPVPHRGFRGARPGGRVRLCPGEGRRGAPSAPPPAQPQVSRDAGPGAHEAPPDQAGGRGVECPRLPGVSINTRWPASQVAADPWLEGLDLSTIHSQARARVLAPPQAVLFAAPRRPLQSASPAHHLE